jgi:hypothetical protein
MAMKPPTSLGLQDSRSVEDMVVVIQMKYKILKQIQLDVIFCGRATTFLVNPLQSELAVVDGSLVLGCNGMAIEVTTPASILPSLLGDGSIETLD